MNIFFDVQGTLLSGGEARPHVRRVFEELIDAGHHVYIWSSGGAAYAGKSADILGVGDLTFGTFSKDARIPVTVDFVVDDFPHLVAYYGGCTVEAYFGDDDDDGLLPVIDAVRAHEG